MHISKLLFTSLLLWQCQTQPSKEESLRQRLDALSAPMIAEHLNGGAVHVEMGGKVLFEKSFGYADFTTKEKFTANTVANLGSISKTFVAYGILQLQEQGKLSMASSKITDGSHPDSDVAHAYIFQNGKSVEFDYGEFPTFCASGNGGVWSSISDLMTK